MIRFEAKTEAFEEWLFNLSHQFLKMTQTMIDVFELFKANSHEYVPLDTGRLEESFHYRMLENSSFIVLDSIYSAVDPESGYDYAYYQHQLKNRGKHGSRTATYLGSASYYVRALEGHPVGDHHRHGTRGTDRYLFKGVDASESLMWTIIEQDYMELFNLSKGGRL